VNKAIGERLVITKPAVASTSGRSSPGLPCGEDAYRRILAVLVWLSRQRQGESIGM
jgi:hypothetical protein